MCENGTFGQDCTQICGKCVGDKPCHHIDGTCMNGCDPGYKGNLCTEGCLSNTSLCIYKQKRKCRAL